MDPKDFKPGLYLHYKGKKYRAYGVVKHSETLEDMVYYECLYKSDTWQYWVRPFEMFTEEVQLEDGRKTPRFKLIEEEPSQKKRFEIGQKALIVKDNQILVIKRDGAVEGLIDLWDFPGGRIKWGESVKEGLKNELKEETNLELRTIGLPLSVITFFPSHMSAVQLMRLIYPVTVSSPDTIKLSKEHSEYRWVDYAHALELSFPDNDYHTAIKRIQSAPHGFEDAIGEGMLQESIERKKNLLS